MEFGARLVVDAWRELAGAQPDGQLRVVVNPESWLAPPGWVGIVAIGDVITASVPRADLEEPVQTALAGFAGHEATSVDALLARMPPATATLGPAQLFYPPGNFEPPDTEGEKPRRQRSLGCLLRQPPRISARAVSRTSRAPPSSAEHETARLPARPDTGVGRMESPTFPFSRTRSTVVAATAAAPLPPPH